MRTRLAALIITIGLLVACGDPAKLTVTWTISKDGAAASCASVGASKVVIDLSPATAERQARSFPPVTTVDCAKGKVVIEMTNDPYDIEAKLVAADGTVLKSSGKSVVIPMTDGSTTVPYVFALLSPGQCNAQTCGDGCCDGSGQCVTGARDATACGSGGAACAACPNAGDVCNANGQCVPQSSCGPCENGCCNGSVCVPATSQSSAMCGLGGASCAPCAKGDTCASGVCAPPTGCNATTCGNGCCNLEGVCRRAGTSEQNAGTCGKGGEACKSCGDISACSPEGVCLAP
jgi:hypothetical protein